MAVLRSAAVCLLIIAAVLPAAQPASPPAPAPSPGVDCFPYLLNVSDCLSYVESGSNQSEPEKGCCPELVHLVDTQPVCLCQLLGPQAQLGIPLDISRALKLPSACNTSAPPVTLCAALGVPVTDIAPSGSPSPGGASLSPGPAGFPSDVGSAGNSSSDSGTLFNYLPFSYRIGLSATALLFINSFF